MFSGRCGVSGAGWPIEIMPLLTELGIRFVAGVSIDMAPLTGLGRTSARAGWYKHGAPDGAWNPVYGRRFYRHGAPDGAWPDIGGGWAINMALLRSFPTPSVGPLPQTPSGVPCL